MGKFASSPLLPLPRRMAKFASSASSPARRIREIRIVRPPPPRMMGKLTSSAPSPPRRMGQSASSAPTAREDGIIHSFRFPAPPPRMGKFASNATPPPRRRMGKFVPSAPPASPPPHPFILNHKTLSCNPPRHYTYDYTYVQQLVHGDQILRIGPIYTVFAITLLARLPLDPVVHASSPAS